MMRKYILSGLIILLSGCSAGLSVEGVLPKLELKQAKLIEPEITEREIGLYPFRDDDTRLWGFLDDQGNTAIEAQFSELKDGAFKQGVAAVKKDGRWGFINYLGQFVVEPKYRSVTDFSANKTAPVITDDRESYYIDRRGKKAIVPKQNYQAILPFSEGLAAVQGNNGKWGFIDEQGNEVIQTKFDLVAPFSEGLAAVKIGGRLNNTYIDRSGQLIFPPELSLVTEFKDERALVHWRDKGLMILASNGETLKTFDSSDIYPTSSCGSLDGYSNGLLGLNFMPKGKYHLFTKCGFVDQNGNIAIDAQFDEAKQFSEGLAAVKIDNKWGYIDRQGNTVIEPKFDKASSFNKGLAVVTEPPLVPIGYINQQGEYVWKSVEF